MRDYPKRATEPPGDTQEGLHMDIFGSALLDHASGLRDHPITIRRDDDFVDEHSPGLYFEAEPFAHEAAALEHVQGPVLDIGCGAGRHLLWLATRGIEAAGIDASPGAIETCRQRGCPAVTLLDVMTTDLAANTRFETALLFGNNIGIGGTFEGAQHLLSKIAAAMSKTGRLLLTSLDVARTQNPIHMAYHQRNLLKGRPKGEITMRFEYRGKISPWCKWYHPQPQELEPLVAPTPWRLEVLSVSENGLYHATLSLT